MNQRWSQPAHNPFWSGCLLGLLAVPILLLFVYFHLASDVFRFLALYAQGATIPLAASLIGSVINLPLTHRRISLADPHECPLPPSLKWLAPILHYYPPRVTEQVIALNVGGGLAPVIFSAHLLTLASTSLLAALGATVTVAALTRLFARLVPGQGVVPPALIPTLVAALAAREFIQLVVDPLPAAASVAYLAGTQGTLIGADLLTLPAVLRGKLLESEAGGVVVVSIGGAGVFDGIFLTGILAPVLASV